MKRRFMSLFLVCVMLFCLLPTSAWAADQEDVYIYTLIPGITQGSTGGSADDEWNGMGLGTTTVYDLDDYDMEEVVTTDPAAIAQNISFPDSFPNITVSGTAYKYAATGSANADKKGYYTIEWTRLVVSGGANAGNNNMFVPVSYNIKTFHLDGQLILNETSYHTVSFALKDIGSNNFVVQSEYSVRVVDGFSERNLTVPSYYNKTVNGVDYVFDGWYTNEACTTKANFNDSDTITQNTTYYARYNPTYTVTYTDGVDGVVVFSDQATSGLKYGAATPSFRGGTPDRGESYIFLGWKAGGQGDLMSTEEIAATTVVADVIYIAQWEEVTYTVTWMDSDGTVLEVDENVKNGQTASYNNTGGTTDSLAATKKTDQYTYSFAGWSPSVTAVNGTNQFYRATYTTTTNTYKVTWQDSDGTVLETDEAVAYGVMPEYNGGTNGLNTTDQLAQNKSDADPAAHYNFAGWTPVVTEVTGDQIYTATYTSEPEYYTINWMNYGTNKVFNADTDVPYNSIPATYAPSNNPERTADSSYEYVFVGWTLRGDPDTNNIYYVTANNSVTIGGNYDYMSIAFAPKVVANQVYDAFYVAIERTYTGTVRFTLNNGNAGNPSAYIGTFAKLQLKGSDDEWYELTGATVNGEYVYQNTQLPQYTEFEVYADNRSLEHSFEIVQTDNTMTIRHYSVSYDANGDGVTLSGAATVYSHAGEIVTAQAAPTRYGYEFLGWNSDNDNDVDFAAGATVTSSIQQGYVLKAEWKKLVDVYVNIVIDHYAADGVSGHNNDNGKHNITFTLDQRAGNTGNYEEITHKTITWNGTGDVTGYNANNIYTSSSDTTIYIANAATFTNVDPDMNYTVTTNKSGYELDTRDRDTTDGETGDAATTDEAIVVTQNNGDIYISVYLVFAPNDFDFSFSVKLDTASAALSDENIKPDYALVKITSWSDSRYVTGGTPGWYTITQHKETYIRAAVDSNDSETFPVWMQTTGSPSAPYFYRVEVVGFELEDGTIIPANETTANVTYESMRYSATIDVTDGGDPDSTGANTLTGAWYENNKQNGTVTVIIHINTHTVTIDPNGGQWSDGSTSNVVFSQKTVMPNFAQYVPTNGYKAFNGYIWYEDANGNGALDVGETTPVIPLASGAPLSKNYILVADWLDPIKVQGDIEIITTNTYGDETYPARVVVELRKYNGTETAFVKSVTATVNKDNQTGSLTASYSFENLFADQSYRVLVRIADYTQEFANEGPSVMNSYHANNYNAYDHLTEDGNGGYSVGRDNIAQVDIKLTYQKDAEFTLQYEVDTTAIGEGYRPTTVKTRPWYYNGQSLAELGSAAAWENALKLFTNWKSTIVDNAMAGHAALPLDADGRTSGSYPVEPYRPNGNAYNYAVYLHSEGGTILNSADGRNKPYTVSYVAPAYYVESTGMQDEMLKIILTPKKFDIVYKDNNNTPSDTSDDVTLHTTTDGHTWSHVTNLKHDNGEWKYIPTKSGSVFAGWYSDAALTIPVTNIAANVAATTSLYAKWNVDNWADAQADANDNVTVDSLTGGDGIPDNQQIHIVYQAGANGSVSSIGEIVTISGPSAPAGSTATANAGYAFDGWSRTDSEAADAFTFTNAAQLVLTKGNVVGGKTYTFQAAFDTDAKGNPTGGGDGTPDKYQLFIEYYSSDPAWGSVTDGTNVGQPVRVTLDAQTGETTITVQNVGIATPVPKDRYTFDYWTQDGGTSEVDPATVLAGNTFQGNTTIKFYAHFAIDEWADAERDGTITEDRVTDGDNIPDYKQALVRYVATTNNRGEVTGTGTIQVFTLTETNSDGKYVGTIDPDDSKVIVTPYTGFAFDYWGDTDNYWGNGNGTQVEENKIFGAHTVVGEQIIVYTAHFSMDVWADGEAKADDSITVDSLTGGDKTPDNRQVLINYVVDNMTHGEVSRDFEVITLDSKGPQDVTAIGSTATAKDGYVFESWSLKQRSTVEFNSSSKTIQPNIKDAMGTDVYVFTATFAKDANGDEIPDKYQATVKYVSEDESKGTVTVASEIVTICNNGRWDYIGSVVTSVTGSTAQAKSEYIFKEWRNTQGINLGDKATNAKLSEVSFEAEAEKEYVFTASFEHKSTGLMVTKTTEQTTAAVGETIVWTVKVANTGNITLTDISLTDTLYAGNKVLTNLELKDTSGNIVTAIAELQPGANMELSASYKVTETDAGMTLKNVVVAATPNDGPTDQGESATTKIPDPYIPPVVKPEVTPDPPKLNKEDHFAYIIGKDDGLVHPLDPITRAETATIFFRMLLEESRQAYWTQENNFVDVAITDWYNNAASTLNNAGIMTGRPGGQFAPYANITRGEFATLAVRFFLDEDVDITENNLTDVKGHWAEANINLAYALGLITGYPDDTFKPNQEITRAEAMVIVNRVLERHPDKDHLLDNMVTWPDNMDPNVWYYADVQEATNSHLYVLMTDEKGEKYEIWQQLLPVRDWAALEKEWSEYNSSHNPGEVVDVT